MYDFGLFRRLCPYWPKFLILLIYGDNEVVKIKFLNGQLGFIINTKEEEKISI